MEPTPVEISEKTYPLPHSGYETVKVITLKGTSAYTVGMISEVEVPEGGVEIHFLEGGIHLTSPPLFITSKAYGPPPKPSPELTDGATATVVKKTKDEHSTTVRRDVDVKPDKHKSYEVQPVVKPQEKDGPSV
jgi:hypothetical protein